MSPKYALVEKSDIGLARIYGLNESLDMQIKPAV